MTEASLASFGFDLASFEIDTPRIDDAISVYASVYRQDPERSRQVVMEAARRNDFVGRVAFIDGIAVAMAYGAGSKVGQWWYDTIAEALGSDHPALQSSWNLMELAVLSSFRRRGLATALVDDLLFAQPLPACVVVRDRPQCSSAHVLREPGLAISAL
jgi:ribosomal protein S18 acetylase RimI-like enzyme